MQELDFGICMERIYHPMKNLAITIAPVVTGTARMLTTMISVLKAFPTENTDMKAPNTGLNTGNALDVVINLT